MSDLYTPAFVQRYLEKDKKWREVIETSVKDALEGLDPYPSVLDVGCGYGRDMQLFKTLGFDVWGIDSSAAMIVEAQKALGDRAVVGTIDDLSAYGSDYGLVWCRMVLVHITPDHIENTIAQLVRCVRRDGYLIITSKHGQGEIVSSSLGMSAPRTHYLHDMHDIAHRIQTQGMILCEDPTLLDITSANGDKIFQIRARKHVD